jgi:GNAT superfamily N-acetyltransferase
MSWRLDEAHPADGEAIGKILSDWIDETEWMPRLHPRAGDREFCIGLMGSGHVRLLRGQHGVAGFVAREGDLIPALYVAAPWRGHGLGRRLIDDAKALSPGRLTLWTFQANEGARRFYKRAGFAEVELTDGSHNQERMPDVRLMWEAP